MSCVLLVVPWKRVIQRMLIAVGVVQSASLKPKRRAAEQGAGADRFQRLGTWRIFMRFVLVLLVLVSLAAAQLARCAACVCSYIVHYVHAHTDTRSRHDPNEG